MLPTTDEAFQAGHEHGVEDAMIDEGSINSTVPCEHGEWCPYHGTHWTKDTPHKRVKA